MNTKLLLLSLLFGALAAALSGRAQTNHLAPATNSGPRIVFAQTSYDFGKVESGELVKYSFGFTNAGNQTLQISEVRPGCGCTTAGNWDKEVAPGKTGTIPIAFSSAGYGGMVQKTISVTCNDPNQSSVMLQFTGTVWKPIEVSPAYATFSFGPDVQTNQTAVLRVLSHLDAPVTVSDPTPSNPAFRAELRTVKEGKEYEVRLTAFAPSNTTSVVAPVTLKTSYAKTPVLTFTAIAMRLPAVSVIPSQVILPAGPLADRTQPTVTIHNNGNDRLVLSQPAINVPGAEVQLKEVQPGREFSLTLAFPAGFQSKPGQAMEATVQSSNPGFPFVKVPVTQLPSPPAPSPAAPSAPTVSAAGASPDPSLVRSANAPAASGPEPKIEFTETAFDFGRVQSGTVVTHTFSFTNTGAGALEIRDVISSCGCTATGTYTRRVEPGGTGSIPVMFNTSGMGGPVGKTLWVSCNDPRESNILLRIAATVWKPIDALPGIAAFSFGPDFQTNETRVIRLVNNLEEPVKISEPVCTNRSFRTELKTVREGKEFELRVTVVPPLPPGSTLTPITLETSSPKMPVVAVNAYATVQPALIVTPPRIALPTGPLAAATPFTVTIQNRNTNALNLSEAVVNAKGAAVQVRELQPGRMFSLTVTFPAGFEAKPGQDIEVQAKSSHPQFPFIRVPVAHSRSLGSQGLGLTDDSPSAQLAPVALKN